MQRYHRLLRLARRKAAITALAQTSPSSLPRVHRQRAAYSACVPHLIASNINHSHSSHGDVCSTGVLSSSLARSVLSLRCCRPTYRCGQHRQFASDTGGDYVGELLTQTSTLLQQGDDHTVDLMLSGMSTAIAKDDPTGSKVSCLEAVQACIAADSARAGQARTHAQSALSAINKLDYTDLDDDSRAALYLSLRIGTLASIKTQQNVPDVTHLPTQAREFVTFVTALCQGDHSLSDQQLAQAVTRNEGDLHLHTELVLLRAIHATIAGDGSNGSNGDSIDVAAVLSQTTALITTLAMARSAPTSAHTWWALGSAARAHALHAHLALQLKQYDDAMNAANEATQYRELLTLPSSPALAAHLALAGKCYGALSRTSGLAEHFMYAQGLYNSALKSLDKHHKESPLLASTLLDYADVLSLEVRHKSAADQARARAAALQNRLPATPPYHPQLALLLSPSIFA